MLQRLTILLFVLIVLQTQGFSQSPDFSLHITPAEIVAPPGEYVTYTIEVRSIGGFNSQVRLEKVSVSPWPIAGHVWSFDPGLITPIPGTPTTSQFRFRSYDYLDSTHVILIRGVSGGISHEVSATVRFEHLKDYFTLLPSAQSVVMTSDNSTGSAEILVTVKPMGNYNSPVDLILTETFGIEVTFEKTRLAPWETIRVKLAKYANFHPAPGAWGIQIRGVGAGGTSFNLDLGVRVVPGFDFASGEQRVLFVPVRAKGASQTATIAGLQPHIDRAVEYFREVSYGKLRIKAEVPGRWYNLPGTTEDYDLFRRQILPDSIAAIDSDFDLRNYPFYVILMEGMGLDTFPSAFNFSPTQTNDGFISFAACYLNVFYPTAMVHEMGHMFYLPDLYDVSVNRTQFITYWDEMAQGPAHFAGWSRMKLGWLSPDKITDIQPGPKRTITLSPIELTTGGTKLIRIPKVALSETTRPKSPPFAPSFSPQRAFYLEARKKVGFDSDLPSNGVLIYSVDESLGSGRGPLRIVDRIPATPTLMDAAFSPNPGDSSTFEDAANSLKITIVQQNADQYDIEIEYLPPGKATLSVKLESQAAMAAKTSGTGATQAGYGEVLVTSGPAPYASAVISFEQNGAVVSEVGVPVTRPTTAARVFVDYRPSGTLPVNTGFAAVNRSDLAAALTITLRDPSGTVITSGTGTLAKDGHIAKFVDQLGDIAPGFSMPAAGSTLFGTLEVKSDQPISIIALRLTTNQRGEVLLTTTPIADMKEIPSISPIVFPQFAEGGGYTTSVFLINTSNEPQSGVLRWHADDGSPMNVRMTDGTQASSLTYSIPVGGARVFQTEGNAPVSRVGSIRITPDTGKSVPAGVALFQYSQNGVLITQTGVSAAAPTTRARIYVDMSGGHDTGLALVNPGTTSTAISVSALTLDGTAVPAASQTITLDGFGHSARLAREFIPNLPAGFRGIVEITAPSAFAALTLRSLVNSRGDYLLTTLPVADLLKPVSFPIVFPQVANGGGYTTEFILLGAGSAATLNLNFLRSDGTPLPIGK